MVRSTALPAARASAALSRGPLRPVRVRQSAPASDSSQSCDPCARRPLPPLRTRALHGASAAMLEVRRLQSVSPPSDVKGPKVTSRDGNVSQAARSSSIGSSSQCVRTSVLGSRVSSARMALYTPTAQRRAGHPQRANPRTTRASRAEWLPLAGHHERELHMRAQLMRALAPYSRPNVAGTGSRAQFGPIHVASLMAGPMGGGRDVSRSGGI